MIKIFFPTNLSENDGPFIFFGLYEYQPDINLEDIKLILIHYKLKFIHSVSGYKIYTLIKK